MRDVVPKESYEQLLGEFRDLKEKYMDLLDLVDGYFDTMEDLRKFPDLARNVREASKKQLLLKIDDTIGKIANAK